MSTQRQQFAKLQDSIDEVEDKMNDILLPIADYMIDHPELFPGLEEHMERVIEERIRQRQRQSQRQF